MRFADRHAKQCQRSMSSSLSTQARTGILNRQRLREPAAMSIAISATDATNVSPACTACRLECKNFEAAACYVFVRHVR
jgi:hypothetical protein